jgi:hypothetical protein
MDKAFQYMGGLLLVLALAAGVPLGVAVATGWTPAQTNAAMTGVFAICGGSVALFALALGAAVGLGATRGARQEDGRSAGRGKPQVVDWELDEVKRQQAVVNLQRAMLAAERDRRRLLPEPEEPEQIDPADAWLAQMPAWEFVDAAGD